MARTKDAVLAPEQKELMEKEYLDFVKPSTYGNIANPSSCDSLYDDVENPELRAIVEKVAATTPYREETSTNEAQSPPNPQKRISGKQRKATLEEYQQTFLQVSRIDDRKPVFVSSDARDRLDRVVRILGGPSRPAYLVWAWPRGVTARHQYWPNATFRGRCPPKVLLAPSPRHGLGSCSQGP